MARRILSPDLDERQEQYEREQRDRARSERDQAEHRARGAATTSDPWQESSR